MAGTSISWSATVGERIYAYAGSQHPLSLIISIACLQMTNPTLSYQYIAARNRTRREILLYFGPLVWHLLNTLNIFLLSYGKRFLSVTLGIATRKAKSFNPIIG